MGTRAIYTFEDNRDARHVFVHYDGYPTGAAAYLQQWQKAGTSWPLPRFEADEAAAGFIAAIKDGPGNVRICSTRTEYADVEFGYTVTMADGMAMVTVAATDYWDDTPMESVLWEGPLSEFQGATAEAIERGEAAA